MTNMIEELFYGNIDPNGRGYERKNKPNAIFSAFEKSDKKFLDTLSVEQIDAFTKYKSEMEENITLCEREAFMDGIK